MSLKAMEEEIHNQTEDLPQFAARLRLERPPLADPLRTIFAGAGDSYAAALFAQGLSRRETVAEDPHELLLHLGRARARTVVLVSVSGKTRSNLLLAKSLNGIVKTRIAVTADSSSPLARLCDETVVLRYRKSGPLTAGTVSFTTSLLACSALLGQLPGKIDVERCVRVAASWARRLKVSPQGSFLFIGSGLDRGLAEYGACKVQEVLGANADAQYPEQVGHARLFSIDKENDPIFCITSQRDSKMLEIFKLLSRAGFNVSNISAKASHPVTKSLEISIHLQRLALSLARKRGLRDCAFLKDKKRLELSSGLIY